MKLLKPLAVAFLLPATFVSVDANIGSTSKIHSIAKVILSQDSISLDKTLPFDNEVLVGTLKNGFKYYIRRNVEPEKRVTMYLGIKVGSILETDEEQGLAHFLEHMNFNGLKHFPKNELVNYLQKAGVRFGSDLNAHTGFDETVYKLPIPSDDPELLKNGLQVMRDWAQDALLDTEEIDKERDVIMEEMRGSRGANQRMRDKFLPVLLNGSLYSKRLPIGTEEIVTTFKPELIREFHKKWYRPDLQSLIIVGDIDVAQIEKEVIRLFSDMTSPAKPEVRKEYKVDLLNKNQFIVVADPEMQHTVGQIIIKHREEKVKTVRDYRSALLKNVFNQLINSRLRELSQQANPPFLQGQVSIGSLFGGLDNMSLLFVANPGKFDLGLKTLVREMERFEKYGFTETEFQRVISSIAKGNEISYIERDKKKSDVYVESYLRNFIDDAPSLSNEDRYQLTKQLLPTLTLKEVENVGKKFYADVNRDVIIMAPEKDKALLPTEDVMNAWISEVKKEDIIAYEDKVSELPLLTKQPAKGVVTATRNINGLDAKEIVLSNGVKVILKPTTFKNDQILISAFSPGGTSLYPDAEYMTASNASGFVNGSGVGQLNAIELRKYLTGKHVNVSPYISERSEGISGSTDKEGLKTAFELIYGYFTEPRLDDDIFQSGIARTLSSMENREDNPDFVYSDMMLKSLYGDNIRRIVPAPEKIKTINQQRALEIYRERFADASDFTFIIVGSFTEEEVKPYLEQYLAALPSISRKEEARNLGILEPNKGFEKIVHKGKEEKVMVQLKYYGDYDYSEKENLNFDALESVLSIKLTERLREDEGGVYGTGARGSSSKYPIGRYSFSVGFGTSVDKYQSLINSALDEINKVKKDGPTQIDLDKFIIEQKRQLEIQLRENTFWMGQIAGAYQNNEDPTYILRYLEELDKLTIDSVKEVANKYLKEDRLFKFILLPETGN
ncbi:M16 family metallopeptidase [Sphingobacterium lumbrici]|uniref:M16 family metallopeptidase n=1 Tax=Sphingobacterium lumbrici TaxID=2559600 RepID=UPI00112CDF6C|nr:M16 family metallopeptidase [Sphingobacterium lumbrici]